MVTVSSPDGQTSLSYTATIKESCTRATLDNLVIRGPSGDAVCDLVPHFEPKITEYSCLLRHGVPANLTVIPQLSWDACPHCKLQLPDPLAETLEDARWGAWAAGQSWTRDLDSGEKFTLPISVSSAQMLSATYHIHFAPEVLTSLAPSSSSTALRHTHARPVHSSGAGPHEVLARPGGGAVGAVESGLHSLLVATLVLLFGAIPITIIKVRNSTSRAASYAPVDLAAPRSEKGLFRQLHLAYEECIPRSRQGRQESTETTTQTWKVLGPLGLAGQPLWCVVSLALVCALAALLVGVALASSFTSADADSSPFVHWLLAFTGIGGLAALVTVSLASGCHLLAHLDGPSGDGGAGGLNPLEGLPGSRGKSMLFESAAVPLETAALPMHLQAADPAPPAATPSRSSLWKPSPAELETGAAAHSQSAKVEAEDEAGSGASEMPGLQATEEADGARSLG